MSLAADRRATYGDLLLLPAEARAEILAGEIVTSPAPLPKHSRAQRSLGSFIGRPYDDDDGFGGPGGWWIFVEVDVQLDLHNVLRPDLSGWRRERLPEPAEVRPIEVVPDWVCEVLSPSTSARDRVVKRDLYALHGVPHYWIVDTDARCLEAFALREGTWMLTGNYDDSAVARIEPFTEVALEVGRLFLPSTARDPATG